MKELEVESRHQEEREKLKMSCCEREKSIDLVVNTGFEECN